VGLKAKLPKCNFGANIVQYPVFRLTWEGITRSRTNWRQSKMLSSQNQSKK
jgi:hypothetical protein